MIGPRAVRGARRHPNGFTLVESLMASAILLAGVLAVISAITTGQQKVIEAQLQMQAVQVAESLLDGALQLEYADLGTAVGAGIETTPLGDLAWDVQVDPLAEQDLGYLGIVIAGSDVRVRVRNVELTRTLVDLTHFIPEPQS